MPLRNIRSLTDEQLGRIVEGAASEIYVFSSSTYQFLLLNRGARDNLGYPSDELYELTPWHIKPRFGEDEFRQFVQPLIDGAVEELKFETVHRRMDGTDYDVSVHLQLIPMEEEAVFFAAIRDITSERQLKTSLEEKAKELEAALAAKEALLHEVNHRVKNSLQVVSSLLKVQARQANDAVLKQSLDQACERVNIVATIHHRLYTTHQHAVVDIGDFVHELAQTALAGHDVDGRVELETDIQRGIEFSLDMGIPIALVIAELLTNALKYAFPDDRDGVVTIKVQRADDRIVFNVHDNGVGYDATTAKSEGGGYGTMIIDLLVRQLKADMNVESDASGTRCQINVPHKPSSLGGEKNG